MEHIAIMKKSWGLLPKILSGEKTVESRWLKKKSAPWEKIDLSDTIYFKETGGKIVAKATVHYIHTYSGLTPRMARHLLTRYHKKLGIRKEDFDSFYPKVKDSRYVLFITFRDVQKVVPFKIEKTGFGAMSAWICVEDIDTIRIDG